MTYINCKNIEIRFGYGTLIAKVNINLNPSEKIAFVGVNGCGKTSLLRVLAGLARPYAGQVYCMEEQIWPNRESSFEHLSFFLSSQPALLLEHTVLWNLEYYCRCYHFNKTQAQYQEALNKVGLLEKSKLAARLLSTGQKRRLTFAALLLIQPKIILADEPTNGLDEAGINLCYEIFDELTIKNKAGIIVASHDKDLINFCDSKINIEQYSDKVTKKIPKIRELL